MKIRILLLALLLLTACQSSQRSDSSDGGQQNSTNLGLLFDNLPSIASPTILNQTLLSDYPGQKIDSDLVPKLSSPMAIKEVIAIAQIQGLGGKVGLLYYAYPTDSEVDDYDQMVLLAFDEAGNISAHLPLDVGGTGFASTQNWIKEDGEILTAVIAEMEQVEVEIKTYRFQGGNFTEARQLSKIFQNGSYQEFLDGL
ncbi:MAG: hypothetical protein HRU41_04900 [Saprospiraceae bacterium]|nr:hypothetical protein [Saprospiraceae bacterium]